MLAAIGCLLALSGCIFPPPIDEGAAPDNNPPRILPDAITPALTKGPIETGIDCADPILFAANVTDADPEDTIYWRVFVDYYRDPAPWKVDTEESPPDRVDPTRAHNLFFTITPKTDTRFGLGDDRLVKPHTVELLVADRPFATDSREPQGRALDDDHTGGLTDSSTWTISMVNGNGCPQ